MNKKRTPTENLHISPSSYHLFNSFTLTGTKALKVIRKYLNSSEQLVALNLEENMNYSDNSVHTDYTHITKEAHVSRATVASALKRLRRLGLIHRDRGTTYISPDWKFKGNRHQYQILKAIFLQLH